MKTPCACRAMIKEDSCCVQESYLPGGRCSTYKSLATATKVAQLQAGWHISPESSPVEPHRRGVLLLAPVVPIGFRLSQDSSYWLCDPVDPFVPTISQYKFVFERLLLAQQENLLCGTSWASTFDFLAFWACCSATFPLSSSKILRLHDYKEQHGRLDLRFSWTW